MAEPELDQLTRELEALCERRDWDGVVALRDRCRAALERGKQWWPVAAYAEYRLALEAPGPWAGAVIVEGAGRFAFGPLTEVAASTHTWAELADHIPDGPLRSTCAHERVVRREDLTGDRTIDRNVLPAPLALQPFEPNYPVATYHPGRAEFPAPPGAGLAPVDLPPPPAGRQSDESRVLREVVNTWVIESNGHSEAVEVDGDAATAIAALGVRRARGAEVEPAAALAHLSWTAASGGAHGRRRGMAWGRYVALDCAATLAGVEIEDLAEAIGELRWFAWDAYEPATGWTLRLAVEDPGDGIAWAVTATDTAL